MAYRDEVLKRVWHAHDMLGLSIPQIASRLRMGRSEVHACIIEIWGMPAKEKASILGRRRDGGDWEDE